MRTKVKFKAMAAGLAVLGMLASCSVNDDINEGNPDGIVRFSASVGEMALPLSAPGSRASGTDWTLNDKVGLFMVNNSETTPLAGADNKQYEITTASTGALSPVGGADLYYPTTGSVDFFAYYPYQSSMTGYNYQVDVSDQTDPEKIDLLRAFANGSGGNGYDKGNSSAVPLTFDHKLTKFIIKTEPGEGLTASNLQGMTVTIKGMNTEAVYNVSTDGFTGLATPAAIVPVTVTGGEQYEAIVIPATSGAAGDWSVEFEVTGETYVWQIPAATELESGKEHTWTITVQKTPVGIQGTINNWGTGNGGSDVAE